MNRIRLHVHTRERLAPLGDDDAVGNELVALVQQGLSRGSGGVVGIRVREKHFDFLPLKPVVEARRPLDHFLASLTRVASEPTQAIGIAGRLHLRPRPDDAPIPVALVFLEWENCRWWQWRALLEANGRALRPEGEHRLCAQEGDAMPHRLGRWWSMGRRLNLQAHLNRVDPIPALPVNEAHAVVH